MNLEQRIEHACEHLPEGWQIRIDMENGYAGVVAIRPDESEVFLGDGETDINEQVRDAFLLARDETAADSMSNNPAQ